MRSDDIWKARVYGKIYTELSFPSQMKTRVVREFMKRGWVLYIIQQTKPLYQNHNHFRPRLRRN